LRGEKTHSSMQSLKAIISGGGTGGHIYPAIAIANALKAKDEQIEILFVGAKNRMEMEKVPAAGFKIEGLWISGFQRKISIKNILFPIKLIASLMKAKRILKNFEPNVVIGVGGYSSGPVLHVAIKMKIPTLIQEQNSFPGITNRMLGNKVDRICVAYDGMERYFPKEKILLTGNPVRQEIADIKGKKQDGFEYFGLKSDKKILLVIGGSLGARTINESISHNLALLSDEQIQVIWQTGKSFFEKAKSAVGDEVRVHDFIDRMDYAYAVADVVVSRAGAIAVSELCSVGKPAILVPSPNVAEDHQTKNAAALVDQDAAILIKDNEAKEKLGEVVVDLMNDEEKKNNLSNNIAKLALRNSADIIADEVLSLARR